MQALSDILGLYGVYLIQGVFIKSLCSQQNVRRTIAGYKKSLHPQIALTRQCSYQNECICSLKKNQSFRAQVIC